MIKWFVGFDQVESVAFHTLCHSIISRSSVPVEIIPLKQSMLGGIYTRERDPKQSNEFSFTRFLVPYLSGYKGWSIFTDCDMLMRVDAKELIDIQDYLKAVQVVKHDYTPKNSTKYLGAVQYQYPCKNWSSVMIFNNMNCKKLTPEYVNNAPAMDLHQFKWVKDSSMIGEIPGEWNHLVGEYKSNRDAKIVHFTVGGPYFKEYENVEYADEWFEERELMNHCEQYPMQKTIIRAV